MTTPENAGPDGLLIEAILDHLDIDDPDGAIAESMTDLISEALAKAYDLGHAAGRSDSWEEAFRAGQMSVLQKF